MLYHVFINSDLVFNDIDEKTLKSKVIKPLKNGKKIINQGSIYNSGQINKIEIYATDIFLKKAIEIAQEIEDKRWEKSFKECNRDPDTKMIFLPENIDESSIYSFAVKVTDTYINSDIEKDSVFQKINNIIKHPFVVRHFILLAILIILVFSLLLGVEN